MAVWRIRLNTSFGGQCGDALATTKKACIEKAQERMPWLSKRHLCKKDVCEKIDEKKAL